MLFFLIFPETVRAEQEDQVDPQAQENPHDSSTDSCLTFPYSSNSPRPFPPSPVHSVTDSPKRVSPLPIATNNPSSDNSAIHSPIVYNFPTPVSSTLPISIPSQTFTSALFTPTTNSYNTSLYIPYSSSSFPQTGPIVFPGSPPDFPYFRTTLSGSDSTLPNTVSLPFYPMPSMVTPTTIPIPFFSTGSQSTSGPGSFKRSGRDSRGTYSGRGRASRDRRGKITSTTSCQTSPIPSYFWPDYQPSPISSGGSSANNTLNVALMPRVFDHFPTSLPLNPLHFDLFTALKAASPVVSPVFIVPLPFLRRASPLFTQSVFPVAMIPDLFWLQESYSRCYYYYIFKHIIQFQYFIISSYKDFVLFSFLGCLRNMRKDISYSLTWA